MFSEIDFDDDFETNSKENYQEKLKEFILKFSQKWFKNPQNARLLSREILSNHDKSRAIAKLFWSPFISKVESIIQEGQELGEFKTLVDPKVFALQLGGSVINFAYAIEFHQYIIQEKNTSIDFIEIFQNQLLQIIERSLFNS